MTTVGQAGAAIGMPAQAMTIATALKSLGYATGQFGKNHLGDKNEFCPPSTGSMNSSAICITWTRWKTHFTPLTRKSY